MSPRLMITEPHTVLFGWARAGDEDVYKSSGALRPITAGATGGEKAPFATSRIRSRLRHASVRGFPADCEPGFVISKKFLQPEATSDYPPNRRLPPI
jgi:hypothetical protein